MHDGSITFSTELDNTDLERELARLKRRGLKLEDEIGEKEYHRNALVQRRIALEKEISALRKQRQATVVDGEFADNSAIDSKITGLKEEISAIQKQIDKADSSIEKGNLSLEHTKGRYGEIHQRAEELRKEFDQETLAEGPSAGAERQIQQATVQIGRQGEAAKREKQIISSLKRELKATGELASIAANSIKKRLSPAFSVVYQRMEPALSNIRESLSTVFQPFLERIGPDLEEAKKSVQIGIDAIRDAAGSKLVPNMQVASDGIRIGFNGILDGLKNVSGKITAVAGQTSGKLSGAFQSAGGALGGLSTKLSGLASKAGPYAAIAMAVLSTVKKIAGTFADFGRTAVRAFGTAAKAAGKFIPVLADMGRLAVSAVKKAMNLAKKLNVFSRLSENLSRKFQRMGSTIKSALVFSVIYQGLSMVRQQIGAYLSVNAQFMTALRRLQGALLTAFQPVYEVIVPALTALINILTRAIATVTQFFASLFGKTAKQAQNNAEHLYEQANAAQAAGDAAEDASKQMAAFDEINKLEGGKSSGGGAGAETGPLFDFAYEETPFKTWGEAFSAFLDKLLAGMPKLENAFKKFADGLNGWSKKLYDMFKFPGVLEKVEQLGRDLAGALNRLAGWIGWHQLGQALGAGLNLALQFLTEFLYKFNWVYLGQKLAEFVNGLVSEIDWYDFGRLLWSGFKIGLETLAGFLAKLDMPQMARAAGDIVLGFFTEMKNTIDKLPWRTIGWQIADFLANLDWYGMLSSVSSAIASGLQTAIAGARGFLDRIIPELDRIAGEIVNSLVEFFRDKVKWGELARTLGDGIAAAIQLVSSLLDPELFYETGRAIGDFFISLPWVEIFGALTEALASGINAAVAALRGFLDVVKPNLKEIADGIARKINEFVKTVDWAALGQTISDGIEAALDFMIELMDQIDWDAVGAAVVEFLENIDWDALLSKWGALMGRFIDAKLRAVDLSGALDVGMEIVAGLAKGMWNKFQESGGVLGWLKSLLVDPILNGVKSLLGIHSPSTVFAEIGGFLIAGLARGISGTWHTITDFFSEKVEALKTFFSDSWENIKNTASGKWEEIRNMLSAAWENVRMTAGEKFGAVKQSVIDKMEGLKGYDWKSIGGSVVDKFISGLETIWNNLTRWARDVKDTIAGALSGAGSGGGFGSTRSSGGGFSARMAAAPIPDITTFEIPALARGAVIPPNREFLAVLGDQKNGTNIESPVSEIENAVMRAMQKAGVTGGNQAVILQVDGRELGRAAVKFGGAEYQRIGTRLVEAHT